MNLNSQENVCLGQTTEAEFDQMNEYLIKFISLVPNLKQIDQEEKIDKISYSSDVDNSANLITQIENLQNLNLNNSKTISDLQILQSVLDYIVDLKSKVEL
ncbi:unnamed protein product [Brachionus calyciflorus]|uniref:Uncharacterized protein n=1 Tax=Brachionus calyciflorus TaxID=104777 RepID=A0A814EU04_9BILA|nr:unnamed protein product [Brachionus calyciflorus]